MNALVASDRVNIVCETQPFSLNGLRVLVDEMISFYDDMRTEPNYCIIPNKYEIKTASAQEVLGALRNQYGQLDGIKQIPAFMRLVSLEKNDKVFMQLRNVSTPAIAAAGYGIRIDNPYEEKYRSLWHYEYRDQLRSIDGIVFWSPLVKLTAQMGPVQICPKSHLDGLRRSYAQDPENPEKTGAYAMRLENEDALIAQYGVVAPLSEPGDLVLMDFLTLHSSGVNISDRSRWSMQFRYFSFEAPSGISINWAGCVASGTQLKDIHPELVID